MKPFVMEEADAHFQTLANANLGWDHNVMNSYVMESRISPILHVPTMKFENCQCMNGFVGKFCSEFNCFNISLKLETTCSGRGVCIRPNVCSCRYTEGYHCEFNITEVATQIGFSIIQIIILFIAFVVTGVSIMLDLFYIGYLAKKSKAANRNQFAYNTGELGVPLLDSSK